MISPNHAHSLRENLSRAILEKLTEALLDCTSVERLTNSVLCFEVFLHDGGANGVRTSEESPSSRELVVSVGGFSAPHPLCAPPINTYHTAKQRLDLSDIVTSETLGTPVSLGSIHVPAPQDKVLEQTKGVSASGDSKATRTSQKRKRTRKAIQIDDTNCGRALGALRPAQGHTVTADAIDSHRQMQVADYNFPKRAKIQSEATFLPEKSSLGKFIASVWEQIHGGINLEPQSLVEQWQLTVGTAANTLINGGRLSHDKPVDLEPPSSLVTATEVAVTGPDGTGGSFSQNNTFCRKVTQAGRTCRSIEVIVQARWIEHFDSYVNFLAVTNPSMSPTRCRKAALLEACSDFEWSEKELRNKIAVWRGYKEIKDAAGWAALVFAGMGLYRFCKYRTGFNSKSMELLRTLRSGIEVAADTLHPNWRQVLAIIGEASQRRFAGHPHAWVIHKDGSDPVPLQSTYVESDPYFSFEHLDESVIDTEAWGADDPRWIPPLSAAVSVTSADTCRSCRQRQSDDPKLNSCYCYPSLFGGPRSPSPVQVFRTSNGRNNGLQALIPFERGAAIGEFVGLVTKAIEDLDVMDSSTRVRSYQIWQGRQGNYTRFVNHSCRPNAQFQHFVWLSTQRIILVSKGIEAGTEITVDYSESYWRGLDKRCLCGESCCRYDGDNR